MSAAVIGNPRNRFPVACAIAFPIAGAIGLMAAIRGAGFAISGIVAARPGAVPLVYLLPLLTIVFFGALSLGIIKVRPPAALTRLSNDISDRMARMVAARTAPKGSN